MKVVVLADTHVNDIGMLPDRLRSELKSADLIIHAGDYTGERLLEQLRAAGDFRGVYGNMDPGAIKKELRAKELIEIEGFWIGVTHPPEGGSPVGLLSRVSAKFKGEDPEPEVIIYGHSHEPQNEKIGNILYLNPGSATGVFPARYSSFGILSIEKGVIRAEIVRV